MYICVHVFIMTMFDVRIPRVSVWCPKYLNVMLLMGVPQMYLLCVKHNAVTGTTRH